MTRSREPNEVSNEKSDAVLQRQVRTYAVDRENSVPNRIFFLQLRNFYMSVERLRVHINVLALA